MHSMAPKWRGSYPTEKQLAELDKLKGFDEDECFDEEIATLDTRALRRQRSR